MQVEQHAEDLLSIEVHYERASTGKRFANFLIDLAMFYIFMFLLGMVLAVVAPSAIGMLGTDNGSELLARLIGLLLYAIFTSLMEAAFKGKSIGKFITKTKAVNLDGSQISTSTAFARGFSRAVPFCVFSAFGTPCNPWQDRWTNTMVVNDEK